MEQYIGDPLIQVDLPEIYCSFTLYKLLHENEANGYVRIYVDITHDRTYKGVPYIDNIDISYTSTEYTALLEKETLVSNLILHYLEKQVFSKKLYEYYH